MKPVLDESVIGRTRFWMKVSWMKLSSVLDEVVLDESGGTEDCTSPLRDIFSVFV